MSMTPTHVLSKFYISTTMNGDNVTFTTQRKKRKRKNGHFCCHLKTCNFFASTPSIAVASTIKDELSTIFPTTSNNSSFIIINKRHASSAPLLSPVSPYIALAAKNNRNLTTLDDDLFLSNNSITLTSGCYFVAAHGHRKSCEKQHDAFLQIMQPRSNKSLPLSTMTLPASFRGADEHEPHNNSSTLLASNKFRWKPYLIQAFTAVFIILLNLQDFCSKFVTGTFSFPVLSPGFSCRRMSNCWRFLRLLFSSLLLFSTPYAVEARVAKHVRVLGDVMLYGLFPVHQRAPASTSTTTISPTSGTYLQHNHQDDEQQQQRQITSEDYNANYYSINSNFSSKYFSTPPSAGDDDSTFQPAAHRRRQFSADDGDDHHYHETTMCDSLDFVGIYLLEAALFAIDRAAAIMPEGVTLGADFSDTCSSSEYALRHARHYAQQARAHNAETRESVAAATGAAMLTGGGHEPLALGLVGPAHDDGLERTAELLSQYSVPQIAYWATTPSFADKSRFPYMFRSIPDARYEATAVLDLLKQLGWNVVHIVYAQDGFYRSLAVELDRMAAARQICVGSLLPGPSEAEFKEEENNRIAMRVVRSATKSKLSVNVVLWLGKAWDLQYLLRAMNETGLKGRIQLVGLSAWGDDRASLNDYQHLAEGALTLKMPTPAPLDFQAYFSYLRPTINPRNPWFVEFWETYFRCQFVRGDPTFIKEGYQICTNNEEYSQILDYDLDESAANYVIDAVLAFAHAFRAMHFDKCRTFPGICPLMRPFNLTELTFNYLRNVSFDTLTPLATGGAASSSSASAPAPPSAFMPFSFHHGSNDRAEAHFQILNFQRDTSSRVAHGRDVHPVPGRYRLEHVGNWYSRAAVRHNATKNNNDLPFSSQRQQHSEQLRGRIFLDRSRLQTLGVQPIACPQGCQTCSEFVRPKVEPRPPPPPSPAVNARAARLNTTNHPNAARVQASAVASNQSASSPQQPVAAELDDADDYGGANDTVSAGRRTNAPAAKFQLIMLLLLVSGMATYRKVTVKVYG